LLTSTVMEIRNETPFEFIALPGYDKDGLEVFTNIVKGTFAIHGNRSLAISENQVPIAMADEYWGEPGVSPVKYESDLAVFKPSTDLILLGYAYHPDGRKISRMDVVFGGGSKRKKAAVTCAEARDRISLALMDVFGAKKELFGSENLGNGFGFYPRQYKPRVDFAGTYDEHWRKERFPFLPADFDYRYFQSAYPELVTGMYLRGNEAIFAENVSSSGPITVDLPGLAVSIETVFETKSVHSKAELDTIILEPEENRALLLWRQMVPCHNQIKDIRGFVVGMSGF